MPITISTVTLMAYHQTNSTEKLDAKVPSETILAIPKLSFLTHCSKLIYQKNFREVILVILVIPFEWIHSCPWTQIGKIGVLWSQVMVSKTSDTLRLFFPNLAKNFFVQKTKTKFYNQVVVLLQIWYASFTLVPKTPNNQGYQVSKLKR